LREGYRLALKVHLVDGTYELFRAYYAVPPRTALDGRPVAAVRGLIQTMLALLRSADVTHVACAFDHVIESFRNGLLDGYKTGANVPEDIKSQFDLAETATSALGVVVWPMEEFEADDALATAAARWGDDPEVEQVVVCSPDKDLTQVVRGNRVVCLDRRRNIVLDQAGVEAKLGVSPGAVPDFLALVGDTADGIPGIPGWGRKSAAQVLRRYGHIEQIPLDPSAWDIKVRGAEALASNLNERRGDAMLYRILATLRLDVPLTEILEDLRWRGVPRRDFRELCRDLGFEGLMDSPHRWADDR